MQIHQLKRSAKLKKGKYIGRGGKRGTTSGRGTKGQMARSGHKLFPEMRDRIKKLPKLRGYHFKSIATKAVPINLSVLEKNFENGAIVNTAELVAKGLDRGSSNKNTQFKILAEGELTKKLTVEGVKMSAAAKVKIEQAGGTVK